MNARRSGLTLVELLMVLSLMTITTSVGAIGLAGLLEAADEARDVMGVIACADASARSAALEQGPTELRLDDGTLVLVRTGDGTLIGRWTLPAGEMTLRDWTGRVVREVRFGADGRCMSYLAETPDDVWQVNGLTGWIEQSRSTP